MAKRVADSQITRETFREDGSDSDNENGSSSAKNMAASASTMRKRKIAMPKRINGGGFNFQAKSANANGSNINNNNNNKQLGESQTSNAFKTFQKTQGNDNSDKNDTNAKLKALNSQFKDKLIETLTKDPFADLRPILEKYKQYIEPLKSKKSSLPQQPPIREDDLKSPSEEDEKEVKIEGPKFTLRSTPTTSKSVFTFGAKKDSESGRQDKSDSENEVEIKGPQFTINGEVKSDVFKLKKPATKEVEKGNNVESEKSGTDVVSKTSKPVFKFGQEKSQAEEQKKESNADLDKAGAKNESQKKPTFGFNFKPNGPESSPSEPDKKPSFAFKFGQEKSSEQEDGQVKKPKPDFSFGIKPGSVSTGEKKGDTKPAFSFASQPVAANVDEKESGTKPVFSFGNKPGAANTGGKENGAKPIFSFGSKPGTASTGEKESGTKPAFSFGSKPGAANTDEKESGTKPAFSFGSTNSSTAPSFNFSTANNKEKTSENKAEGNGTTSAGGFKFSLPFNQKPASQTSSSPSLPAQTATPQQESKQQDDKEVSSKPIEMQNGEENENVLFSQRSKLMAFNSEAKSYDSRGLGELKLLQNKENKSKVRLLCRSDGMGNILLNTNLVKKFTYSPLTPESENLIKLPVVEAQGKLVTFVAKFKQKSDGRLLVKSIEDVKKDM